MHMMIVVVLLGQCQGGACLAPRLAWPPAGRVLVIAPGQVNECGCSALCTCGCNDGQECRCGNVPGKQPEQVKAQAPGGWPPPSSREEDKLPTGVDCSKLGKVPRFSINGREVTEGTARRAIEALADDSAKPHLTVIGDEMSRRSLRVALEREAWLAPLVRIQDYPPDHWSVARHRASGTTVYLQRPDGGVMVRAAGITEASLADLIARLKQALSPPPKQPGKPDGGGGPPPPKGGYPWRLAAGAAAALILALILTRR
jgi:hypothetical protein